MARGQGPFLEPLPPHRVIPSHHSHFLIHTHIHTHTYTQTSLPSSRVAVQRDNARRLTIVGLTSNDLKNGMNIEVDGTPMRVSAKREKEDVREYIDMQYQSCFPNLHNPLPSSLFLSIYI